LVQKENPGYKDGKCLLHGKIIPTSVQLKFFDINNTVIGNEPLYKPKEIVIADTRFQVIVRYPLRNPVSFTMFAPSEYGFTRAQLIDSLQKIYEFVYREEERTATPIIYEYRETCPCCKDKDTNNFLKNIKISNDELCSICYSKGGSHRVDLPCGHNFHKKCILPWIQENNTCPLCRSYVIQCEMCDGRSFISLTEENVVIPVEYRGTFRNRNTTDGVFGIWGYDFEDLYIEKLFYNREQKNLEIFIGS